jgi:hypothetical protein
MEAKSDSSSKKDTAKILQQKVEDSLWINENLKLPDDRKISVAVIKGARAGFIYHLNKPYVLIGRGKVDLIIPDKEVSRKHMAIEVRNEKIFLRDLGSTNGTFINATRSRSPRSPTRRNSRSADHADAHHHLPRLRKITCCAR